MGRERLHRGFVELQRGPRTGLMQCPAARECVLFLQGDIGLSGPQGFPGLPGTPVSFPHPPKEGGSGQEWQHVVDGIVVSCPVTGAVNYRCLTQAAGVAGLPAE